MRQTITQAAAALILCSTAAVAHDVALDGDIEIPSGAGYVVVDGVALRTGDGECLRLPSWSEENQVNACEGIEEPTAEAEPEPESAPAPAPEPPKKEPIVTTATLGGEALFESNSAVLTPASEQALADLLVQLESFQEITDLSLIHISEPTRPY